MDKIALNVQGISKKYPKSADYSVKDISFELEEGSVLGIIGRNGAGKSTLLKILANIIPPTSGRAIIVGKISALLEVGTGFHPELSGLENIYLNGAILGLTRRFISSKLEEIIDFSGVKDFINKPLKTYSSGMKIRLGFSVAAFLQNDILLLDEVLAVGDMEFQKKCLSKVESLSKTEGRTVLFVSHNLSAIHSLTNQCMVIDKGNSIYFGDTNEGINHYLQLFQKTTHSKDFYQTAEIYKHAGIDTFKILAINMDSVYPNIVQIDFEALQILKDFRMLICIYNLDGLEKILVSQSTDNEQLSENRNFKTGKYSISCHLPLDLFGKVDVNITIEAIHPYMEHHIFRDVITFKSNFSGYNQTFLGSFEDVLFRPQFKWTQKQLLD